ncbi:MAG: glycoside hydrolase family 3 N-terminal domain-containing protein [Flavipsychrobacter sp.]
MIMRKAFLGLLVGVLFTSLGVQAQDALQKALHQKQWVDSVYQQLSLEERIGQLFMVAAYSGGKNYNEEQIKKLVAANQVGGLIFMQGTPEAQAEQNNAYQTMSKVPLLIGMDAEWGLGMRLTGVKDMPKQMMVGATEDTSLAYRLGAAIAYQCKRMGVHINFGPVVDVNNNPRNPIINARAYGEDKYKVASMGIAYMRGLQDYGIMACAKHFPGHGDTETDSHKDLPTIKKSITQLEALELYPFRQLIGAGVQSMMVAHLDVPALETEPHIPTTLSKNTISTLLKERMGFNGLVFTDALNMQGVAKYFEPGDVDLRAFLAGNDVLLFSQNVPVAISKIKAAIAEGKVSEEELERRVRKILTAKYRAGLYSWQPVVAENATADLNRYTDALEYQIAISSVTLLRDMGGMRTRIARKEEKVGYVGINANSATTLYKQLKLELGTVAEAYLPKGGSDAKAMQVINRSDIVVVAVHNMSFYPTKGNDYGLDTRQMNFLKQIQKDKKVVLVLLGNPYLLQHFCDFENILVTYEDNKSTEEVAATTLLKITSPKGALPVSPCNTLRAGTQIKIITPSAEDVKKKLDRAGNLQDKTLFVDEAGVVNSAALDELSMFLQRSVADGAFPGCQVFAAKDGKILFNRAYGYQDVYKKRRVETSTVYDVASLTKVLSTTLAVMRLYEQKRLDLNKRLVDYLPWVKGTDKANLRIKNLLLHQAGLKSWIPFYKETLDSLGDLRADLYRPIGDNTFGILVAENLYLRSDYADSIWNIILTTPLENQGKYVYSDLDFYFLAKIVEKLTNQPLDVYMEQNFYKPMGLTTMTYRPLKKIKKENIAPTENDIVFRRQTVHGFVHDPGAAMFGGVAGHAGLFATAEDVGIVFQMLLNGGVYNGVRFFQKSTIDYFSAYNSTLSRRGLGFDKPKAERNDAGPTGDRVSGYAYGHQGFTGTCAWADPATGVVFVFLSNRVNPSATNWKINQKSVRTKAQDYIYESLGIPINRDRPMVKRQQLK